MEGITSHILRSGIAEIEFYSKQGNSLKLLQLDILSNQIIALGNNPKVKAIILKSKGTVFCSGANFNELLSIDNETDAVSFFSGFASVINAMRRCPKLIISIVQGKAVGGGVGLIAASDYVIANYEASVKLSELSIGIGPFVIGPAVQRKVGISNYMELALCPREWKDVQWAKNSGLINEAYESLEIVYQKTLSKAIELSSYSSEAMKRLKDSFWKGTEHWDSLLSENAKNSGQLLLTDACQKSLKSFLKS